MAKGAATEKDLGAMHSLLTKVYTGVLDRYIKLYDAIENIPADADFEDEMVKALLETTEPNPALLSAISKFLKDNEIMYDTEELGELSAHKRKLLQLKAKNKGKVVSITDIPQVENG